MTKRIGMNWIHLDWRNLTVTWSNFDRMMDFLSLHVCENRSVCQIKSSCISKQCKQKCGSKEEVYKWMTWIFKKTPFCISDTSEKIHITTRVTIWHQPETIHYFLRKSTPKWYHTFQHQVSSLPLNSEHRLPSTSFLKFHPLPTSGGVFSFPAILVKAAKDLNSITTSICAMSSTSNTRPKRAKLRKDDTASKVTTFGTGSEETKSERLRP